MLQYDASCETSESLTVDMNSRNNKHDSPTLAGLAVAATVRRATAQPARGDFRVNPAGHNGELCGVYEERVCQFQASFCFKLNKQVYGRFRHNGLPLFERFWRKVELSADGCWVWRGALMPRPNPKHGAYGCFRADDGKRVGAHRQSYIMAIGPIPPGMVVMHRCDNPQCVRPSHLQVGTHKQNTADSIRKGRFGHQWRMAGRIAGRNGDGRFVRRSQPQPVHAGERGRTEGGCSR